jgi:hypothetical protein
VAKNQLILSNGKRQLKLPKDAYREFYLRPAQIFRTLMLVIKTFNIKQIFSLLKRIFQLI